MVVLVAVVMVVSTKVIQEVHFLNAIVDNPVSLIVVVAAVEIDQLVRLAVMVEQVLLLLDIRHHN